MSRMTQVLVGIFVVLGGWASYSLTRAPERGMSRVNLANLQVEAVDRLVIYGPSPATLSKDPGGVWRLDNGRAADPATVSAALGAVQSIVSGDLMTEDPERFAEYEVDDAKGTHVQVFAHSKLAADFVMGKMISGGSAVRLGQSVYKVINIYNGSFGHAPGDWLDKEVVKRDAAQAKSLQVALRGQPPYTLLRQADGSWEVDRSQLAAAQVPRRFDSQAGGMLVSSLASLRVQDILEVDPGDANSGLADPQADRFTLTFDDSQPTAANDPGKLTLILGKNRDDHTLFAKVAERPDVYTVSDGLAQGLRRPLRDLQALTLMADFEPQQVRKVSVRDGAKWVTLSRPNAEAPYQLATSDKPPKPLELDQTKAMQRAGMVRTARALGVAQQQARARASLGKSRQRIEITLEQPAEGGAAGDSPARSVRRTVALLVGGPASEVPNAVYATGTADSQVYYISDGLRRSLLGMASSLTRDTMGDSLSNLAPGSLSGLPAAVRKQVEKQLAQGRQRSTRPPS